AVRVKGHESPSWINRGVNDRQVNTEVVCDVLPVLNRGPTERIGADVDATGWIADRANELLADPSGIRRKPYEQVRNEVSRYDYR
ncbi:hypothetical protein, partial [Pseudomonas aeruginosa]|uniref:hypothetical protein n=1 Tax=Pseudomonas aeruginosa TaxID=287 RepID=UPI00397D524A